jgi:isopenicillin-N epimerase
VDKPSRRGLILGVGVAGAVGMVGDAGAFSSISPAMSDPSAIAQDEAHWARVRSQYDVTSEVTHLEHGNWGMMALPVLQAYETAISMVNRRNSYYSRREYGAESGVIMAQIAKTLGCAPDELALTRNATEALQALIGGYNKLRPGDSILMADLDYDSMQTAMAWLQARRGVSIVRIAIPEPATSQSILDAYTQAFDANPTLRMMLATHLSHRTGLVLPIKELCALAKARGIDVIVDAAHSWGQLNINVDSIGADFVGFNLHKWIGAPLGLGLAYIRKGRATDIDPFMGEEDDPPHQTAARVHTGTMSIAALLTVPTALAFHEAIGPANKEARLRYLRTLWAETVRENSNIEVLTPSDPTMHGGITSFRLKGKVSIADNRALAKRLHDEFGIFTVARDGVAKGCCVRVTPNVFTSASEVAKLAKALKSIAA